MTITNNIHVGDVGTVFRLKLWETATQALDLTGASVVFVFFTGKKRRFEKAATVVAPATDGVAQCVMAGGDLDVPGRWRWQARVTTPSGTWNSQAVKFKVEADL